MTASPQSPPSPKNPAGGTIVPEPASGDGMVFRNYGGNYQLRIDSAGDLERVPLLDDARWTATSAPVAGFNCDPALLAFLDSDHNGRIRSDEVRDAIRWLFRMLRNRSGLTRESDTLLLADIDDSHPRGHSLRVSAEQILANLGAADLGSIGLSQIRDLQKITSRAVSNGDGVIPPDAAGDADTAELIRVAMQTIAAVKDASGEDGIDGAVLETFLALANEALEWQRQGQIPTGIEHTTIQVWGPATTQAWQAIEALDDKLQQFFVQCDMVRYDHRALQAMRLSEEELTRFDFSAADTLNERIRQAPLAEPDPEGVLDLDGPVNRCYTEALQRLRVEVLRRVLGQEVSTLTRRQWQQVKEVFSPYRAWLTERPDTVLCELPSEQLEGYLNGPARIKVAALIDADKAVLKHLERISELEKLILYQRWLLEFVNSFVSFPKLYDPRRRSLFEMGTLVIDGRHLSFSVRVQDIAAHKAMAVGSSMYIIYAEVCAGEDDCFNIVTAVTAGDSGGLQQGKRGVFFAADGRQMDARVVDIISNPISLWEAFKAPFHRIRDLLFKQAEQFSQSQQTRIEKAVVSEGPSTGLRDLVLAGSLGTAALGSSFAYMAQAVSKVSWSHTLGVALVIAALVFVPNLLLAWFRLRRRDLTALLEASGWAISIRMRLTGALGNLFTQEPDLPPQSVRERSDLVHRFARGLGFHLVRRSYLLLLLAVVIAAAAWWLWTPLASP